MDVDRRGTRPVAGLEVPALGHCDADQPVQLGRHQRLGQQHLGVEHRRATARNRAQGQLLVPGHTDLPHGQGVERRRERPGDLRGDHDPATGQAQHDQVSTPVPLGRQRGRELLTGVRPVAEPAAHRRSPGPTGSTTRPEGAASPSAPSPCACTTSKAVGSSRAVDSSGTAASFTSYADRARR